MLYLQLFNLLLTLQFFNGILWWFQQGLILNCHLFRRFRFLLGNGLQTCCRDRCYRFVDAQVRIGLQSVMSGVVGERSSNGTIVQVNPLVIGLAKQRVVVPGTLRTAVTHGATKDKLCARDGESGLDGHRSVDLFARWGEALEVHNEVTSRRPADGLLLGAWLAGATVRTSGCIVALKCLQIAKLVNSHQNWKWPSNLPRYQCTL